MAPAQRIMLGNHNDSQGNTTRIASLTMSATMNGITPLKIVAVLTSGRSVRSTNMFMPTGGLMRPISTDAHDDDAEPDGVEAEVHDDREEDGDGEEDHRELLHGGAKDDVDRADRHHDHGRAHVEAGDERLEVGGHGRDVDELREDEGADEDHEE